MQINTYIHMIRYRREYKENAYTYILQFQLFITNRFDKDFPSIWYRAPVPFKMQKIDSLNIYIFRLQH